MISSMGGRDPDFRRTKKSPVLASVSPPPSCRPVRRDQVSTYGLAARIAPIFCNSRLVSSSEVPGGAM